MLFNLGSPKIDAHFLATALDVYASTAFLGGADGAKYGFKSTAFGLGAASFNVGSDGAAFGVTNGTVLNVYQILKAIDARAGTGTLYMGNFGLRSLATARCITGRAGLYPSRYPVNAGPDTVKVYTSLLTQVLSPGIELVFLPTLANQTMENAQVQSSIMTIQQSSNSNASITFDVTSTSTVIDFLDRHAGGHRFEPCIAHWPKSGRNRCRHSDSCSP